MQIIMLRHGLTSSNLSKKYIGRTDEGLCAEGIEALQKIKPDISVSKVYTSTKIRTQQTAKILYPNAEIFQCEGFDEMNFGDFEGKEYPDLTESPEYKSWIDSGCINPCPNGESKDSFTQRCVSAFLDIAKWQEASLHLVVHGGTIMAIMSALSSVRRDYFDWAVPCGGGYELEYSGGILTPVCRRGIR